MASSHLSSSFRASLKASYLDKWVYQVALVEKNSPANAGDIKAVGSILGSGRSPGGGSGNHPSILGQKIPCAAWWAIVHMVCKESDTTEALSTKAHG